MKSRFFGLVGILGFLTLFWMSGKYLPSEPVETEDIEFMSDTALLEEPAATLGTATVNFADYVQHKRECVKSWMANELGLREKTENKHPRIDEYFSNLGWKNVAKLKPTVKRWCGVFMANAWLNCIEDIPWANSKAELAQVRKWKTGPQVQKRDALPGDVISLTTHSHVEGIYDRHPNPEFKFFDAIGGNTSAPPGDSDRREGVHKKTRMWAEVNKVISLEKTLRQSKQEQHV